MGVFSRIDWRRFFNFVMSDAHFDVSNSDSILFTLLNRRGHAEVGYDDQICRGSRALTRRVSAISSNADSSLKITLVASLTLRTVPLHGIDGEKKHPKDPLATYLPASNILFIQFS